MAKKNVTHIVDRFVARVGWTVCNEYSNNVTAFPEEATCKKCLKKRPARKPRP